MKLELYGQIVEKYLRAKFHENPSSGSRVPYGQTDRHTCSYDEPKGRFSPSG
jgi:hypothetical protein